MARWLCWLTLLAAPTLAAPRLTYVDLVHQLTDLDRLTRPMTGIRSVLCSSWDRAETKRWGANGDAGQYLRVEPNGEAVMADIDGPGCLYRIWSANPQGRLRVYLDGATTPSYEWDFARLFTGDLPPFVKPLVYQRGGAQSASDAYLPIPFVKHLKVTADQKHGQYYQLNLLTFPKDWQVPTFRLPLTAEEDAALRAAAEVWAHPGTDPKPKLPGQRTETCRLHLAPGATAAVTSLAGPGEVRALRLKVPDGPRGWMRKLVLQGVWDGAAWPQVLSPVGPFVGFDWEEPEYGSLVAGWRGGQGYFLLPMPFRRSAALSLRNELRQPLDVEAEVEWAPATLPPDALTFFARWRHEQDAETFDYPLLETAGRGHLVGVSLQVDHPIPGWWGEGDEKVWVDGDAFPPWIGTGSEDYFGDAWGIRYLSEPSFGCSLDHGAHTCPYRWHLLDAIPFGERLRMTIENYGPNGQPGPHEYEYNSVAYWYQQELTPPFGKLRGRTYQGAEQAGAAPSTQHYRDDLFVPLTGDELRTTGRDLPFALEFEDLVRGAGTVIDDGWLPYPLNRERAVDFGTVEAGHAVAEFTLTAPADGVYTFRLFSAPDPGQAPLSLALDEQPPGPSAPLSPGAVELAPVYLTAGQHRASLVATASGPVVADCFQMLPAPRVEGAMEAEELKVESVGSAPAPKASTLVRGASAGRLLSWQPAAKGDALRLHLPSAHRGAFVLAAWGLMGPRSGILQAFAGDRPLGAPVDLYAPTPRWTPHPRPLGQVPPEVEAVELRLVGHNPASTGDQVDLDYLLWQPKLLGPDTTPGVTAEIQVVTGARLQIQELGVGWLGGHQLWLAPSREGAFVELGLHLPEAGTWELSAKLTTSWDYAVIQPSLDGQPLGPPIDTYSPAVAIAEPKVLGRLTLTAGDHVLRLQAAGRNPASKGYLIGLDYLTIRRVAP